MSKLMLIEPMVPVAVAASRGSGVLNLLSRNPKEVYADTEVGSAVTITVDLGVVRRIDTVMLGYVRQPTAAATWTVTAGVANGNERVLQPQGPMRVPDVAGRFAATSHALWTGNAVDVRYLTISFMQPAGNASLTIGVLVVGLAFIASLGQEWGAGRQPLDTGSSTSLPSGGFSVIDGVRKRRYSWTFGDLSGDETDQLEQLAMALGKTKPGVAIEDAAITAGLRWRIFYGLFEQWKQYERRNRSQTRWEVGLEEWV